VISPDNAIAQGRADIQYADAVPATLASDLYGRCVNAEPYEIATIWAYPGWRWCPLPVMQSYSAYTTSLDNLDAASYASASSGPDAVLREANASLDGRNATWDSPAAMLSLLCHFTELARGGQWQVLTRVPNRCGAPRVLGTLESNGTAAMSMPPAPPGMVVVAEIHGLGITAREHLSTLFTRADARTLTINGTSVYRVVPDTLADGLVLDVPASGDYAAPFNFNLSVESIEAEIGSNPAAFTATLVGVPIH